MDHFLILEAFLDGVVRFFQWVSLGGETDHNHMFLDVVPTQEKPPNPFTLKLEWLKDDDFPNKLKEVWNPFDASLDESNPIQFHQNLKKV
jgi:hypothetical protein